MVFILTCILHLLYSFYHNVILKIKEHIYTDKTCNERDLPNFSDIAPFSMGIKDAYTMTANIIQSLKLV